MGSPETEIGRYSDEGPQHPVRIGYRFAMTETEITRGQFRAFVEATGHDMTGGCLTYDKDGKWRNQDKANWLAPDFEGQTDDHPAVCVNWNDAQAYAQWLSHKTGKPYRLPSETEWEYAARAGTTTRFFFGNDDSDLCTYANVTDRTAKAKFPDWKIADCTDGHVYTAPVRSFRPNTWGLYDMHGNVWEWVQDCGPTTNYNNAPPDGAAVEKANCGRRLLRGGAWNNEPRIARSAGRYGSAPAHRSFNTGLRLTRTLP